MMKKPKHALVSMQDQIDNGFNGFALELLAESYADDGKVLSNETVMLVAHAHNGKPVYILMSTDKPELSQFKDWPE